MTATAEASVNSQDRGIDLYPHEAMPASRPGIALDDTARVQLALRVVATAAWLFALGGFVAWACWW